VRERRIQRAFQFAVIFVFASVSLAAARDIALVSNKSTNRGDVTVTELVKVCKAQASRWPDGKPIMFVMRSPSVPEMKMVLEKVYGMSQSELNSLIVTSNRGRSAHPAILVVDSDEELMNKVASTPGAVGVVDVYSINSSVAIVKIAGKLPLEPGYLLHGN
jgi:hypothetical protein